MNNILNSIVKDSVFGFIATVKSEECINKAKFFASYNYDVLSKFDDVILVYNYTDDCIKTDILERYEKEWKTVYPNIRIFFLRENRGHMFGTIDLEECLLDYIKKHHSNKKYLWKSMDDVLLTEDLLDLKVPKADFYYLPSISHETIIKNYPIISQTTFFIMNIKNVSTLYGNDVDEKTMQYKEQLKKNPELKPWEMQFDIKFDCETHLDRTTEKMLKYCLLGKDIEKLITFVKQQQIGDPSHKNIFFENVGVCHYHNYTQPVFNI